MPARAAASRQTARRRRAAPAHRRRRSRAGSASPDRRRRCSWRPSSRTAGSACLIFGWRRSLSRSFMVVRLCRRPGPTEPSNDSRLRRHPLVAPSGTTDPSRFRARSSRVARCRFDGFADCRRAAAAALRESACAAERPRPAAAKRRTRSAAEPREPANPPLAFLHPLIYIYRYERGLRALSPAGRRGAASAAAGAGAAIGSTSPS